MTTDNALLRKQSKTKGKDSKPLPKECCDIWLKTVVLQQRDFVREMRNNERSTRRERLCDPVVKLRGSHSTDVLLLIPALMCTMKAQGARC